MGKKKILIIMIFAFILCCIGIGVIISFLGYANRTNLRDSGNAQHFQDSKDTKYLQDSNDGKTINVHIGNTLILATSSPVTGVYLTNDSILQPISGVTEVSSAASPTPYV